MNPVDVTTLLTATQGQFQNLHPLHKNASRISFDTRELKPNDIFWALRGSNFDGHDFALNALSKGAFACVVDKKADKKLLQFEDRLIIVEDTLTALQKYAKWHRAQHQVTAIGITGSYGKTTTRELLYSVLSTTNSGIKNQGNQNNEIGVPFTLLKLSPQDQFLIMEMGAAKPYDIAPLTEITSPQIGIITGIGPAHLEGFGSIEQIIETKTELVKRLPENGIAFIPGDEDWTACLSDVSCRIVTFGMQESNHYRATQIASVNDQLSFFANNDNYQLSILGRHHVTTALVVIAVARELGYTPTEIQEGFDRFQQVTGRGRMVRSDPWTVIDDSYNANPVSCRASCHMLANWNSKGKRFLVLGDMLELGPDSKLYHEELGQHVAELGSDYVLTNGPNCKYLVNEVRRHKSTKTTAIAFDSRHLLLNAVRQYIRPDDIVLVKGSRGMEMEQIVNGIPAERVPEYLALPN
ncbi:MAG: UDP-N-acetylmuramoyl-tripeptide--D-alanyl-D-alanine ligase [Planctomycetaceae bacterium]|nr:UDP-N-acetylmuramoyl-tripeptide--D-alanyl-D-alanine ligase [Planctomycetaceae bacterium]